MKLPKRPGNPPRKDFHQTGPANEDMKKTRDHSIRCHQNEEHFQLLPTCMDVGDIELNPGPPKKETVYPCGLCEHPVTWNCREVCCDGCNIWHHNSCIELCSKDYELLEKSNVQWISCKCESINISSFTFRSYELETSNIYEQITGLDSTMDSISSVFSPLKSSSPKSGNISSHSKTRSSINQRQSQ
ncbi:unnamed protein product [Mytilus coruscus]|uniref:PHD-type domain-containing protein n=1 Tax=Mytilus coruscus TaxID=42192 RepID=A0A6J8AK84_MYTCO|nr:unnamed protein product [Mytilus coruscus]